MSILTQLLQLSGNHWLISGSFKALRDVNEQTSPNTFPIGCPPFLIAVCGADLIIPIDRLSPWGFDFVSSAPCQQFIFCHGRVAATLPAATCLSASRGSVCQYLLVPGRYTSKGQHCEPEGG